MIRPIALIPTKDNAGTIADVVRRARAQGLDVLVVDDGSSDGSGALAEGAGATVVTHATNLGKGWALLTGFRFAADRGFTHAIALDADAQHFPEDLPSFVAAIGRDPSAIWIGVRDLGSAPGVSRFGRSFSNFWIRVETGVAVTDSQSGFRGYPLAPVLGLGLRGGRYEFEVQVLTRAAWAGVPLRELPIRVYYPPAHERVTSFDKLRDNVRITRANIGLLLELALWPPRWVARVRGPTARSPGTWGGVAVGWLAWVELIRRAGRWPVYAGMLLMSSWYLLFAGEARRVVMARAAALWPERGVLARLAFAGRTFYSFAVAIVDRFVVLVEGREAFQFDRNGLGAVFASLHGRGFLLFTAHLGNPELSGVVLQDGGARRVVTMRYVAPGDPYVALGRRYGGGREPEVIALNDGEQFAALAAVRALDSGAVVAIKADRAVDGRTIPVQLAGESREIPAGPFFIAGLSGAPVVFLTCVQTGWGRYEVRWEGPFDMRFAGRHDREARVRAHAAQFAAWLDGEVRRHPEQYYEFR